MITCFGIVFILFFVLFNSNIGINGYNYYNGIKSSNQSKSIVIMNSTNIERCQNQIPKNSSILTTGKIESNQTIFNSDSENKNEGKDIFKTNNNCIVLKIENNQICILNPSDFSIKKCSFNNSRENNNINESNFGKDGLLIVDTKFNNQYSYELVDPLNPSKKIRINLDLAEHDQSNNNNINSPRIELLRENSDGGLNMSDAKNQEIIWEGNIKSFYKNIKGKYQDEIYIDLIFNTGHHTGHGSLIEKRAFGVLFDVSGSSNPYLFEYRDNGKYVRFDADLMKQLGNTDFIFYSVGKDGKYHFINNLTNTDNVKLKVKTYVNNMNKRVVEAYIDNGSGKEIPYWILKDVSKLKDNEKISNKTGFLETINQGSGFTSVRSDNIETHLKSFNSLALK